MRQISNYNDNPTTTIDVARIFPHWLYALLEQVVVAIPAKSSRRLDMIVKSEMHFT